MIILIFYKKRKSLDNVEVHYNIICTEYEKECELYI